MTWVDSNESILMAFHEYSLQCALARETHKVRHLLMDLGLDLTGTCELAKSAGDSDSS